MSVNDYLAHLTRNIPVGRKILLVVLTTLCITLLVFSLMVVLLNYQSNERSLREEINVLARVVADRSRAALTFGDRQIARENLHALAAKPSIVFACMYDETGDLFAQYVAAEKADSKCPSRMSKLLVGEVAGGVVTEHMVHLDDRIIGVVYIKASRQRIWKQTTDLVMMMLLTFLVVGVLALKIAESLQRFVTRPIHDLVQASRVISRERDYSIRVKRDTNDELGQLVTAFNEMLEGIEDRDELLVDAKQNLENIVRSRTRELREAQSELVRNERMATLGQLTATVSHELRNPLGTIRTSAFTLANRIKDLDPALQKNLDRIERNIIRCDNIITELLDYSRIRALQHERTNLNEWLHNIVDQSSWPTTITLRLELDRDIDLEMDRDLMRRVINNVMDNACQAIEERHSSDRTIILHSRRVRDRTEIDIVDTGPGIDADVLPHVFEPLFSTRSFGVGLGLAVVKQIMEQHGGGVNISSEPGVGTRVTLWFPASLSYSRRQAS